MAEITSPTIITRINQILDAKVELDDAVHKFNSVTEPSYDDIALCRNYGICFVGT